MRVRLSAWPVPLALLLTLTPAAQAGAGCVDGDGDGFFFEDGCGTATDCNDADPSVHPGAVEICDGADGDCNGQIDDAAGCPTACALPHTDADAPISDSHGSVLAPALAWNGSGFGAAWTESVPGLQRLRFAVLDGSGRATEEPVILREHGGTVRGPALAWNGVEYGLAWYDSTIGDADIFFLTLDASGAPLGEPIPLTDGQDGGARWPALVWAGNVWGLAWFDDGSGTSQVRFTRLARDGTDLGPADAVSQIGPASFPRLAWSGSEFGLAWTEGGALGAAQRFARVDSSGNRIDDAIPLGPGVAGAVGWNGSWAIAGRGSNLGDGSIVVAFVDADGGPGFPTTEVATTATASAVSSLAWSGQEWGISWADVREPTAQVYFRRLLPAGTPLGDAIPVSAGSLPANSPVIVRTAGDYGVLWVGQRAGGTEVFFDLVSCACIDRDHDGFDDCDDCDDTDPLVNPSASEAGCDGVDNDCNPATSDVQDADRDGADCYFDCDDAEDEVSPLLDEQSCDGLDNDCDPATPDVFDADGDGFDCDQECDDADPAVHPAAAEIVCDDTDNDCNPATPDRIDADGDGFDCLSECDDGAAEVFPGAFEAGCDGLDNDCDGRIDPPAAQRRLVSFQHARDLAIDWNGERLGVAWRHESGVSSYDIVGVFSETGDAVGAVLAGGPGPPSEDLALAWTGEGWMLVVARDGDLILFLIPPDGDAAERSVLVSGPALSFAPALARNGDELGLTWIEGGPGNAVARFVRLNGSGQTVGPVLDLTGGLPAGDLRSTLTATGSGYSAVYDTSSGMVFVAVGPLGEPPAQPVDLGPGDHPGVEWNGLSLGLVFDSDTGGGRRVFFDRLDLAGNRLGPNLPLTSYDSGEASRPSITWNGAEWIVGWEDEVPSEPIRLLVARLTADGQRLGGNRRVYSLRNDFDVREPQLAATTTGVVAVRILGGDPWLALLDCACYDLDGDGYPACDDCDDENPYAAFFAPEICNGWDDDCDGAIDDAEEGLDADADAVPGACDNCPVTGNPGQTDTDADGEGNACDLDDGTLFLRFEQPTAVRWHAEAYETWNLYRGDLTVLRSGGPYTQHPDDNPAALRVCGLAAPSAVDPLAPSPGGAAFYLATGTLAGVESGLGANSDGVERSNTRPCP